MPKICKLHLKAGRHLYDLHKVTKHLTNLKEEYEISVDKVKLKLHSDEIEKIIKDSPLECSTDVVQLLELVSNLQTLVLRSAVTTLALNHFLKSSN